MLTPEVLEEDDLIPFLICLYFISFLAWKFFPGSSNSLRYSSIHVPVKSSIKGSTKDQPDLRTIPWGSQARRNQFLARTPVESHRNYADSDPIFQWQLTISKYVEDITQQAKRYYQMINCEYFPEISNAYRSILTSLNDQTLKIKKPMETISSEISDDSSTEMNIENTEEQMYETLMENDNSKSDVTNEENFLMLSFSDTDRSADKFEDTINVLQYNNKYLKDEKEKCLQNTCAHENTVDTTSNIVDVYFQCKSEAHLAIEKSNTNENSVEYPVDPGRKAEEYSEVKASHLLTENFSTVVPGQSNKSKIESSGEEIIVLEACTAKETVENRGSKFTWMEQENWNASATRDESHLKMNFTDNFAKRLTPTNVDTKVCSRNVEDHPGEEFGVCPEKGENCMEVKSIMHSSKNATQSRNEEKEEEEELGTGPVANSLKNGCETESTVSLVQVPLKKNSKEAEGLNAIFRQMIITEIKKHRKKEVNLKRAYSDTESLLPRKRSSNKNRTVFLNVKGQRMLENLVELGGSIYKDLEERSDNESKESGLKERVITRQKASISDASDLKKYVDMCITLTDQPKHLTGLRDSTKISCAGKSIILLERKDNLPCMMLDESKTLLDRNALETRKQECPSKSTQTEHAYVIHAARSCPIRKGRLPLQMQLHRIAPGRGAVCSMAVYASPDFSRYIFRKASDNLIYEKRKASRSPSFIPIIERYRWKYVTPNKI